MSKPLAVRISPPPAVPMQSQAKRGGAPQPPPQPPSAKHRLMQDLKTINETAGVQRQDVPECLCVVVDEEVLI